MRRDLGWTFVKNMANNATYGHKQGKTLQIKGKFANLRLWGGEGGRCTRRRRQAWAGGGTIGTLTGMTRTLRMMGTLEIARMLETAGMLEGGWSMQRLLFNLG